MAPRQTVSFVFPRFSKQRWGLGETKLTVFRETVIECFVTPPNSKIGKNCEKIVCFTPAGKQICRGVIARECFSFSGQAAKPRGGDLWRVELNSQRQFPRGPRGEKWRLRRIRGSRKLLFGELVNFNQRHVTRPPPIGKRIRVGRYTGFRSVFLLYTSSDPVERSLIHRAITFIEECVTQNKTKKEIQQIQNI